MACVRAHRVGLQDVSYACHLAGSSNPDFRFTVAQQLQKRRHNVRPVQQHSGTQHPGTLLLAVLTFSPATIPRGVGPQRDAHHVELLGNVVPHTPRLVLHHCCSTDHFQAAHFLQFKNTGLACPPTCANFCTTGTTVARHSALLSVLASGPQHCTASSRTES